MELDILVNSLSKFFHVADFVKDPQMSQFVPMVYQKAGIDYTNIFEKDFCNRFDGLMLKGSSVVNNVYLGVFPTPDVIEKFLKVAVSGDIFFSHHPIYIENGDPQKGLGRGWQPLSLEHIEKFKEMDLSFFSCHSPMDYHLRVGTRAAMMDALHCFYIDDFFSDGTGPHGLIGLIEETTSEDLTQRLLDIFSIPYLDIAGQVAGKKISKIALIAGGADNVAAMKQAELMSADAYVCGEFNSRFDTPWGLENQKLVDEYVQNSQMAFFGVSHAACEYLTFKRQLRTFFESKFGINAILIEQKNWWF